MRAYQERPEQAKAELRSAQTVERTTAAADGLPAGRKRPRATVALQRSNGNAAVHRLLEQAGWLPADPYRHTPASDHAGTTPTQRSTAPDVLRSMGTPLAPAVRRDMEQRFGVDFSGVRLHTGPAARRSAAEIRARAYTCGNHVVIGEGGGDRHTLAHELAHVIQQRRGPVAGTEQGSGLKVSDPSDRFEREAEATATSVLQAIPTPASPGTPDPAQADGGGNGGDGVLQRTITFAPFAHTTPMPVNLNHYWNQTDLLISPGLTYANGGTVGNALYLEKLLNNSGGGSNPGEPKDIEEMRLIDVNLVRARGQTRAATAMHAINGDFVNGANNTPDNIFMGSAKSNTQEHFHKVERPIRSAMQSGKHGLVAAYETMMATQTQIPLGPGPNMIGWVAPGQDIPGASSSPTALKPYATTYPLVTHVLDKNDPLKKPEGRWPKLIVYRVTPNYTYSSNPQYWPQFLKDNYQEAEKLVLAEQAKPLASQNAQALNYEIAAMKILFNHAHELFPATFTCDAEYYIASYDPSNPWHCSHDNGTYDAEV